MTVAASSAPSRPVRLDLGRWTRPVAVICALALAYAVIAVGAGNEAQTQFTNALTIGAVYALIALGYTMVYGIIELINFAHGDVFTLSAFYAIFIAEFQPFGFNLNSLATSGPLFGSPRAARAARRSAAGRGVMVAVSTPGGISTTGARSSGAACNASAAGYEPADTTMLASRRTRASAARAPGKRAGTVTSAPWRMTP